jgi:hypothetical protein
MHSLMAILTCLSCSPTSSSTSTKLTSYQVDSYLLNWSGGFHSLTFGDPGDFCEGAPWPSTPAPAHAPNGPLARADSWRVVRSRRWRARAYTSDRPTSTASGVMPACTGTTDHVLERAAELILSASSRILSCNPMRRQGHYACTHMELPECCMLLHPHAELTYTHTC